MEYKILSIKTKELFKELKDYGVKNTLRGDYRRPPSRQWHKEYG